MFVYDSISLNILIIYVKKIENQDSRVLNLRLNENFAVS